MKFADTCGLNKANCAISFAFALDTHLGHQDTILRFKSQQQTDPATKRASYLFRQSCQ